MRTRESNRTKSYAIKKYDFEGSSDEEPTSGARRADASDANFDGVAAAEESDDADEVALEQEALESDNYVSEPDGIPDRFLRQQVKPIHPFNVRAVGAKGYVDIEPVADGRIVRTYCGPYDRSMRGGVIADTLYGNRPGGVETIQRLVKQWRDWRVLPPKPTRSQQSHTEKDMWSPNFFQKEAESAAQWYLRVQDSIPGPVAWRKLTDIEAQPYRLHRGPIPVLMGPVDSQQEVRFEPGTSISLTQHGLPFGQDQSEDKIPSGWIFDVGGIVIALDWAPLQNSDAPQVLALCVIPHWDHKHYDFELESRKPDFQKHGIVQLWEFPGERTPCFMRTSQQPAKHLRTLCFEHGRARRAKWSPACGFLAVICGDGNVYVVVPNLDSSQGYEKLQQPVATLSIKDEEGIKATALTWINLNRLVIGYSDGSIALWSIRPTQLLSRDPVHHTEIVDLVSGYPTLPYVIASTPVGGTTKLVDLRSPSIETNEVQSLTITAQPNLLAYSDHLLGFFSIVPSAGVLKTLIGFMHHSQFPMVRRIFTGQSLNSCISVGRTHPFLLVGSMDGSLWSLNPQTELFSTRRGDHSDRIRVFQHEHRPGRLFPSNSPISVTGISRIVHGFLVEQNINPTSHAKPSAKPKSKKAKKKQNEPEANPAEEDEGADVGGDPTRGVVYEPMSRVTVVEWNPNREYGCWAAAALGSGLVKVMDLGLEMED